MGEIKAAVVVKALRAVIPKLGEHQELTSDTSVSKIIAEGAERKCRNTEYIVFVLSKEMQWRQDQCVTVP